MKKQLTKNLIINIFSFIASVVIGLWMTPYLLKHLGLVAYGLIPLAMFFSQYIGVIINSINMSINRFLLIALQQNKKQDAISIFSTSLVIMAVFVFFQALIMLFVLLNIDVVFTIPKLLLTDATWLFGLTFMGYSLSLVRGVYATSLFANNRLDILRTIDIIQNITRVTFIVIFFLYDSPSLFYIGLANILSAILAFMPTILYFKKLTPELNFQLKHFNKSKVSDLSKMSFWILLNQVGVLLLGNLDLYLVNKLLGGEHTGEYAIVSQVVNLFRTLATLFAGVIAPVIMIYHANNEIEKLKKVMMIAAKFMVLMMVVPLALFIGFSEDLIGLWLGSEFVYLYGLISFSLLFYVIAIPIMPLYNVNVAFNKVKSPALVALGLGLINLISIYLLLSFSDLKLWGVVVVKLIIEIIFAGVFMPIHVSKILSIKKWYLFKIPLISLFMFGLTYGSVYTYQSFTLDTSLLKIVAFSLIVGVLMLIFFINVILNKEERSMAFENFNIKSIMKK